MATMPVNPSGPTARISAVPSTNMPVTAAPPTPTAPTTGTTDTSQPFGGAPTTLGATTGTGISSGLSTVNGSNTLVGDFSDTYGKGTGTDLATTLAGLGTSTDSAVTSTNNAILQSAGIQGANISSGEAAAGVSADSSTAALAQGDFASQVNTQLQSTDSQMELGEENTLISALQSEGSAHGSDSSGWDTFGDILTGSQSIAGLASGASAATSAVNPGADTGILDALAMI